MKRLAAREISLNGRPGAFSGSLVNSSADLVTRACRGDQEAFRLIFERYSRPVISFLYDQVNDRELAEELLIRRPEIKMLYIAGYADVTIACHDIIRGGSFLESPFSPADLARKIREMVSADAPQGTTTHA
jgi:hypothetical protein